MNMYENLEWILRTEKIFGVDTAPKDGSFIRAKCVGAKGTDQFYRFIYWSEKDGRWENAERNGEQDTGGEIEEILNWKQADSVLRGTVAITKQKKDRK